MMVVTTSSNETLSGGRDCRVPNVYSVEGVQGLGRGRISGEMGEVFNMEFFGVESLPVSSLTFPIALLTRLSEITTTTSHKWEQILV